MLRIDSGLSTYEKELALLGEDYQEIFEQQVAEMNERQSKGLPPPSWMKLQALAPDNPTEGQMNNTSHLSLITAAFNRPLALEAGYARTFFSALSQRLNNVQQLVDVDGNVLMASDMKKEAASFSPVAPPNATIRWPMASPSFHQRHTGPQIRLHSADVGHDGL
ncbi:hypothetical protein [Vibrio fluvialis]|uniref:hypothetical protein n=1 Tax=Vibrio fluvialis TaxID=676 RepID=UPI001EEC3070|nr:hypothetical protein [Vibrio fluvialis]